MKTDTEKMTRLLRTARGQIDGILKMIEEDRYCVDISNQLMATAAILRKANNDVLRAHMYDCVNDSLLSGNEIIRKEKIEELIEILEKNTK
jgi:CsoR family transcriptional regulator, copper-sensing transcriptional repressor